MDGWTGFFQTTAGASATLTGMLVVAISINLGRILDIPHLPDRAAGALAPLTGVLLISVLAMVPGQPAAALGWELVGLGALIWALTMLFLVRAFPRATGRGRSWTWSHVVMSQAQSLPFIIAGAGLIGGMRGALYWTVPGVVMSVLGGVLNTWVLLVEILR